MSCPFELYLNEKPAGDRCRDCFWWMHTKNKCIIHGSAGDNKNNPEVNLGEIKQFLDRYGFPVGKVGYRNVLIVLELLLSPNSQGSHDITCIYQSISRETGRTISSIRQSIRAAIIWAWEKGSLKEVFPNRQKRPRLIEIYYHLQNNK